MRANFKPVITGFEKNNGNVGETFKCPLQNTPNGEESWRLSSLFLKLQLRAIPKVLLNVNTAYTHFQEIIFEIDEQIIKLEKKITSLKAKIAYLETKLKHTKEKYVRTHEKAITTEALWNVVFAAKWEGTIEKDIEKTEALAKYLTALEEEQQVVAAENEILAEIEATNAEIHATEAEIKSAKKEEFEYRKTLAELGLPEVIQIYNALKFLSVNARLINERTGEIIWIGTLKLAEKPGGKLTTGISESEVEKVTKVNLRNYFYAFMEYNTEEMHDINVTIKGHENLILEISVENSQGEPTNGSGVEVGHFTFGNSLEVISSEITAGYARETGT